nr:DUF348 domain-containing protein [Ardenticatenales bacterium]
MAEQSLRGEPALPVERPRLPRPTPIAATPTHRWPTRLLLLLLIAGAAWLWWAESTRAAQVVTIQVNGRLEQVQSRQSTVGHLLHEQGYVLTSQDIVYPPRGAPLQANQAITLVLARDITLVADTHYQRVLTHAERVGDLLLQQGVSVGSEDLLLLDGRPVSLEDRLPILAHQGTRPQGELLVRRAVPLVVTDEGESLSFTTRERTLGEALLAQNIFLFEGDTISQELTTQVTEGLTVEIARARPVMVTVDGRTVRTRTRAQSVEALLAQQGVAVRPLDIVTPTLPSAIQDDMVVTVTRIDHEIIAEREAIPFETRWEPNPNMELDTQALMQSGAEGVYSRETLIVYVDGQEHERYMTREFVEQPARDHIYAYGTQIVLRTINTPDGPRQYWRKIRMLATSYTAATSGKSRDHPAYGITRTGIQAGFGVVAVDPRVVMLRTNVYVPGYGIGYTGDTGGAIKGRRIDLGYDEWNLKLWYNTVDVYLLT